MRPTNRTPSARCAAPVRMVRPSDGTHASRAPFLKRSRPAAGGHGRRLVGRPIAAVVKPFDKSECRASEPHGYVAGFLVPLSIRLTNPSALPAMDTAPCRRTVFAVGATSAAADEEPDAFSTKYGASRRGSSVRRICRKGAPSLEQSGASASGRVRRLVDRPTAAVVKPFDKSESRARGRDGCRVGVLMPLSNRLTKLIAVSANEKGTAPTPFPHGLALHQRLTNPRSFNAPAGASRRGPPVSGRTYR
jgi:hypothetical protein